jgi:hypothetical protein
MYEGPPETVQTQKRQHFWLLALAHDVPGSNYSSRFYRIAPGRTHACVLR